MSSLRKSLVEFNYDTKRQRRDFLLNLSIHLPILIACLYFSDFVNWASIAWMTFLAVYIVVARRFTRDKRRFKQESQKVSAIVTRHPVSSEFLLKHFDYTAIEKTNWSTLETTERYYQQAGLVEKRMQNPKLSKEDKELGKAHIEKLAKMYSEQFNILHPECDPRAALQKAIDDSIAM